MNPMNPEAQENPEYGSYTETFLSNPGKAADELRRALKDGLAPEFVEKYLEPLLSEAQNVNRVNKEAMMGEATRKLDSLRSALLAQLNLINSGSPEAIKKTVENFAEERDLDIKPTKGHAVNIGPDMRPDWTSKDGEIGLRVTSDSVWVYRKVMDKWIPTFLKDI